jgi:hypothetical protein
MDQYKKKYLKYKNKYLELKKQIGGIRTFPLGTEREPLFKNHKILDNKIIDGIISVSLNLTNLPLFLISTLFFSLDDYNKEKGTYVYNRFVVLLQAYHKIYLIDYENMVGITKNKYNLDDDSTRNFVFKQLIDKCNRNTTDLFILCCKYNSYTPIPSIEKYFTLFNPRPLNMITISAFQIDNFILNDPKMSYIHGSDDDFILKDPQMSYIHGSDDDFIFWLLALSLFNIQNDTSTMVDIHLITNDIQKVCDLQHGEIKNLYLELTKNQAGDIKYVVVNNNHMDIFVSIFNSIIHYMKNNVPQLDNLNAINIPITGSDIPVIMNESNKIKYEGAIESCQKTRGGDVKGFYLVNKCNSNTSYIKTPFVEFKRNIQKNCTNFFIQLISYIKYIQNIKYNCNIDHEHQCSLSFDEIISFLEIPDDDPRGQQPQYNPSYQQPYNLLYQQQFNPSYQQQFNPSYQQPYNPLYRQQFNPDAPEFTPSPKQYK